MKELVFKQIASKWFIDLPDWEGDINDLQMVKGADDLLNAIDVTHVGYVLVSISDNKTDLKRYNNSDVISLTLTAEDEHGATYTLDKRSQEEFGVPVVWLCPVTLHVFDGAYPPIIYIIL